MSLCPRSKILKKCWTLTGANFGHEDGSLSNLIQFSGLTKKKRHYWICMIAGLAVLDLCDSWPYFDNCDSL